MYLTFDIRDSAPSRPPSHLLSLSPVTSCHLTSSSHPPPPPIFLLSLPPATKKTGSSQRPKPTHTNKIRAICSKMLVRQLIAFSSMSLVESYWTHSAFVVQRKQVHLPSRHQLSASDADENFSRKSVTGQIYDMPNRPCVKLFTKQGCTLCDKVKDVSIMHILFVLYTFSTK